jgi:hypothetical protein
VRRGKPVILMLVVAGLAAWAAWRAWPSDERRITRALEALAADTSVDAVEAPVERLARAARIGAAFTEDATLEPGGHVPAVEGRDAIVALAARLRGTDLTGRLRFADVTVSIDADRNGARTTMTATITTRERQTGGDTTDAREVEMRWVRQDGHWRISRAAVVSTLQ